MLTGNVLITGGAGFLGRGIMRQAARERWDCRFTVYSRDEYKQHLCRDKFPSSNYVLGDIRDTDKLSQIMTGHNTVIHAAALKYVPEAEKNVDECVDINIGGTQSVIKAAWQSRFSVNRVIFISTDKAVEPLNVYGMSKALAEKLICEAADLATRIRFTVCRYGNVIGSTGSVVPVFKKQFETKGRVSVTDPDMTRFWLTADDAVDLIEIAASSLNGSITVPVPGAVRIGDIAEAIAGDKWDTVGVRPGEKMHEKLLTKHEYTKSVPIPLEERSGSAMIGSSYYSYTPHVKGNQVITPIDITSDKTFKITAEDFMRAAEDAANV